MPFIKHIIIINQKRKRVKKKLITRMKNESSKGSKKGNGAEMRRDRKSGSGLMGSPKKGGHGGKFTWSGDGYSPAEMGMAEKVAIDANDPNFEEDKDKDAITTQ
ncbi:hypothetical protein BUALT_Bualt09G0025700 [Buddleja alternifolia]|uniref:Programmed cell death protein 4-like n=1 Tax=Buddleja alternifolia TaxID=168488 RepID=A0AAV6X149_9LAMI|nr:hypothetical protein BUALT_Bualt09G0025700 [Buddleja alternifolia]